MQGWESDIHSISPKTPAPKYQPIERKKRKGKIVEDYRRDRAALVNIIIIIIKKDWQCKAGRWRLTPYQSEDPSPTLPTYRGKEETGKIVENKKGESN